MSMYDKEARLMSALEDESLRAYYDAAEEFERRKRMEAEGVTEADIRETDIAWPWDREPFNDWPNGQGE